MDTNICVPLKNGKVDNPKKNKRMLIEVHGEFCIDKLYGRCTRTCIYKQNEVCHHVLNGETRDVRKYSISETVCIHLRAT